ncbi:hypothetical protein ABG82_19365 [Mycobacteroides immunogenum]|uniref:DUF7736 domain-containing protein n=2 Tax=Mycobacteroides immunogenum TaxID=83262 RepID=A0A7V8LL15_9MYCO|nr:hypothetical protein ABG82_19365 [Mycobacteroides immunogenum]ANO07169.1 hypothetical protein BAB75_19625 [Mycobacteroides immunogenum]KIU38018.1 hypothetical protein TL11_24905 [Mycobacteroides immunogenum]KPG04320.1 hypothetical protein AN909_23400 [Mycobacteroides immunogenum]KPG04919.1 hypothetical protein AN908_23810 [Mycobacteroides immunogenum]
MTNAEPREFPIGVVVTLALGNPDRIFCLLSQVYDVLGYMLGYVPLVSEMAPAFDACRTVVREQYPGLAAAVDPGRTPAFETLAVDTEILQWLSNLAREHGEMFPLTPLPVHALPDEFPPQPAAQPLVVVEPAVDA